MTSSPMSELERLDRACRAVSASIAEFDTITDPKLIDELDAALDGLLLPAPEPGHSEATLNTFTVELGALWDKKVAGTDTEGDHAAFLAARHAMLTALKAPVDSGFCACEGFDECVKLGVIKHASHQVLNTATGTLRTVHYFHIGPDSENGVIIQYCPGCGRVIKVNQEALAAFSEGEDHA
ncbi:hypothetical protein [Deinococcus marmoris]|uniref:Uncharacterized protein n=1 Tax=Deinococcus marmoris TaxID=249408 RepID=A0A1U7P4R9_9DEIO|nr:hypothetical protein [Deinococcus marmoris]OLV20150.1 hypothetical protein BOO71_0000478 [Deinococcus marmoris]